MKAVLLIDFGSTYTKLTAVDVEAETVLILLDAMGICVSVGSACTSKQTEASHVLLAMGMDENLAHNVIRITLGDENTKEEVDFVMDKLREYVELLRSKSPYYEIVKSRRVVQNPIR